MTQDVAGKQSQGGFPLGRSFEDFVVTPPATFDPATAIAAARAGAVGLLDLTFLSCPQRARDAAARLRAQAQGRFGLVLEARLGPVERAALEACGACDTVLLLSDGPGELVEACRHVRRGAARIGLVATAAEQACWAEAAGVELIVAKGSEAGGAVGRATTFELLQELLARCPLPLIAWGGIGLFTGAACRAAGAAGVVVDWQLGLTRESPLTSAWRQRLATFDGSETTCLEGPEGRGYRLYVHSGGAAPAPEAVEDSAAALSRDQWRSLLVERLNEADQRRRAWPLGQDAAWAARWAQRGPSVARSLRAWRSEVEALVQAASGNAALAPGSPMARALGTELPLVQAPLARVADSLPLARAVADAGGLPTIGLEESAVDEGQRRLASLRAALGERPWGVELTGTAQHELPSAIAALLVERRPALVLLGEGRHDQALRLEAEGIAAFVHASSPRGLSLMLADGGRRFVFAGSEAGRGAARSSFVLWESLVAVLVEAQLPPEEAARVEVLFGGGLCSGQGAVMLAAIGQKLVACGMKFGALVGEAYLATVEAAAGSGGPADGPPRGETPAAAERLTVRQLHERFCRPVGPQLPLEPAPRVIVECEGPAPPPLDVAIVGMSCLVPGATDLATYWQNILDCRDAVSEVPADRFEWQRWFDPDRAARDKIYSRWGGFLDDVPFDPLKYGIPPAALRSIEPIQLLALELVARSLDDAGYGDDNPHRERTSVIFGAGGGIAELGAAYAVRSMLPQYLDNPDETLWGQLPEWTEDSFAGILMNVVAGRVCNRFDLGGVNFTVDAACASSLAAIYLACRELADGTTDLAIAGGVDTLQSPFSYLCFGKSGALSPRGRSRTFDVHSDGIAISEGLAAVVLKRRADAERDGDRIYALIRAAAGGSDGRSKGMTAPRMEGQLRTLKRAYAQARFSPATVELFEAHGTGTAVGDVTECQSLTTLLRDADAPAKSSAVGSVKSMIGHTKCAAGVAGLVKMALALYHRVLPPTMHVERPNPKAGLVDGPLYVNSQTRPWIRGRHPRRAGVSSFGFGGTNFHAVLEEYQGRASRLSEAPRRDRAAELFLLTGASPAALAQKAREFAEQIRAAQQAGASLNLADLAYTWHRKSGPPGDGRRAALVASSVAQLLEQLDAASRAVSSAAGAEGTLPEGLFTCAEPLARSGRVAFVFPGQGSQYVDMLRELAVEFAEVAEAFAAADAALDGAYDRPLSRFIFPPPAFEAPQRQQAAEALKATDVLQPALGAASCGLLRLLDRLGVRPQLVAGHSYGELTALCAAGAMDESTLYRLSLARGRAIVDMLHGETSRELGAMLAVRGGAAEVEAALDGCQDVWLANLNSPKQTIISGTKAGLARAAALLDQVQLACTPIPVGCAFHSPLMQPACQSFAAHLAEVAFRPIALETFSNTSAAVYDPDAPLGRCLAEHLVSRVRFAEQIEAMYAAGAQVFIEVGPNRVLSRLIDDILGPRPHAAIVTQVGDRQGVLQFLYALGEMFVHHVGLDPQWLYEGRDLKLLDLAALAAEPSAAQPRHMWLVNGGYARPAAEPVRSFGPRARLIDAPTSPQPDGSPRMKPSLPQTPSPAPLHLATAAPLPPASGAPPLAADAGPVSAAAAPAAPVAAAAQVAGAAQSASAPQPVAAGPPSWHPVIGPAPAAAPPQAASPGVAAAASPRVGPALPLPAAAGDWMAQFQETMRAFLASQEAVLTAFLGGVETSRTIAANVSTALPVAPPEPPARLPASPLLPVEAPALAVPLPQPAEPHAARTAAATSAVLAAPAGSGAAAATSIVAEADSMPTGNGSPGGPSEPLRPARPIASASPTAAVLNALLLDIVSQRTGYPAEMLAFDANLEADLGIDSIKKVEIVGAFRRAALPELTDPPAWFMERASGAGTLQQILDGVLALAEAGRPAAREPAVQRRAPDRASDAVQPAGASAATSREIDAASLNALLVEIVSQRTGYPAEMLAFDANLEADLGIDSIKKVEIVGAFRRAALPELTDPPAWFMERVSGAATLQHILDGIAALAAAGKPQAADETAAGEARPLADDELRHLLVDVVSQRTGYPAEMLELDAHLEADLGIDSIKKVEIVGAFRRAALPHLVEPPAWFMEEMTSAANMRAILSGVLRLAGQGRAEVPADHSHGNGHGPAPAPLVRRPTDARGSSPASCPRCVPRALEVPRDASAALPLPRGTWLVSDDGRGLAQRVIALIEARGGRGLVVPDVVLDDPAAAAAALDEWRGSQGALAGLIHLAPLAAAEPMTEWNPAAGKTSHATVARWHERFRTEVRGLVVLLKALLPELAASRDGSFWVLGASLGGGQYDADAQVDSSRPWRGGLWGVVHTLAKEFPQVRFRSADYDLPPDAEALLAELCSPGPLEVGYRGGKRLAIEPVRAELAPPRPDAALPALDPQSVVLVTGGARGITAQIVCELARRSRATFVLLGRTPAPAGDENASTASLVEAGALRQAVIASRKAEGKNPTPRDVEREVGRLLAEREIRQTLAELAAAGAAGQYVACDVQDKAALARLAGELVARHGRIDAIVHGAGIIEDKLLAEKSLDSFDRVAATKVDPLLVLLEAIDPRQLKALVLFSSVSGFFGNPGQVDYAAANCVLNRLAASLARQIPGQVVALNWGPWGGAGMVTPEVARQFVERGVDLIGVPEGRQAVVRELAAGSTDPVVILGPGPWLAEADARAQAGTPLAVATPLLSLAAVTVRPAGGGFAQVDVQFRLDAALMPFLADHMIDDKPVLPMAFVLELAAETAQAGAPAGWQVVEVRDLRAFAGVVLADGPRDIGLRAEPLEASPEEAVWRVTLFDPERPRRANYQALVRLAARVPEPPLAPDLPRLDEPFPLSVPEAYERWLFHGPLLQAASQLRGLDARGIDAVFQPGDVQGCLAGQVDAPWLIDPVVLDACPQLAMLWSRATFDTSPLPNRVEVYHRFGPLGGGPLEALFRVAPSTDEASYRADVWLLRDGRVVGLMEGLEGAGSAALNRITRSAAR